MVLSIVEMARSTCAAHAAGYSPAGYSVGGGTAQCAGALGVCSRFFFSSRRRHTRFDCDWSSDVCSSDLLVLAAARLDLLLGEADPGDLRRGIDDRGDHLVVDLAEAAGDQVRDHHALLLALVRQHRAAYAVPDRPHALHARAAGLIDTDEAALIPLHAGIAPAQIPGVASAADA